MRRVQDPRSGHSSIADRADVDEVEGAIGAEFRIHGAVDAVRPDDECLPAGLPGLRVDVLDEDAQPRPRRRLNHLTTVALQGM